MSGAVHSMHQWLADRDGIFYGADETDDIWLTLDCEPGTGRIYIELPLQDKVSREVVLTSGDLSASYSVVMGRDDNDLGLPPGATVAETVHAASPLMQRFRGTGELAFGSGASMTAQSADERRIIENFFAACR